MADKNPLTPEEVTELFSEIDASGVLDPTLAKKRTERMREKEAAVKRGDKATLARLRRGDRAGPFEAALAQLRSEDRASQTKQIDPLSEDDPSGSQVSHTITKTAMAVVIGILVLIVGMQIGYGVMRRLNTANLSESVSVDTVSTALKGGLEWGNGFTQFPLDFTVDEADERTGTVEVTVLDTSSANELELLSNGQIQAATSTLRGSSRPATRRKTPGSCPCPIRSTAWCITFTPISTRIATFSTIPSLACSPRGATRAPF